MHKRHFTQWLFNFAALGLIAFGLAGVFWLFARAISEGATFLGATLAAGATVGAAVIVRHHDRKKEAEATRRQHLGGLYEQMAAVMAGQGLTSRATEKFVTQFMRKALIYAGPSVLSAFREWRANLHDEDSSPAVVRASMVRFEKLVKAMRKDVGISNFMLEEGDLLRAALADFDAEFPKESERLAPPEPEEEEPRVSQLKARR